MVVCNHSVRRLGRKARKYGQSHAPARSGAVGRRRKRGRSGRGRRDRDQTRRGRGGSYWGRPEATLETFTGLGSEPATSRGGRGRLSGTSAGPTTLISPRVPDRPRGSRGDAARPSPSRRLPSSGKTTRPAARSSKRTSPLVGDHEPSGELEVELSEFARAELSKHEVPREIAFSTRASEDRQREDQALRAR